MDLSTIILFISMLFILAEVVEIYTVQSKKMILYR